MTDYVEIGATPAEEACAQVGSTDYYSRAKAECRAFINQLRRMFGPEPEGARLFIRANPHDFGTYHEVACRYDDRIEEAVVYAHRCEAECPAKWDEEARVDLGLAIGPLPELIVTRHQAAIEWLAEALKLSIQRHEDGCITVGSIPVKANVSGPDVDGKIVCGNLPLNLACLCKEVIAIEFTGAPPRGQEYGVAEMKTAGANLARYIVGKIPE